MTESSSAPDARTGCVTTTTTTTTTTTYTAHRGTYNSNGAATSAPPPTTTSSSTQSEDCPVHGSVALNLAPGSISCSGAGQTNTQIGTVYYYRSGPNDQNVTLHVEVTDGTPNSGYYFANKCKAQLAAGTTDGNGDTTFDTVLLGAAGTQANFDYSDGVYGMTDTVNL